MSNARNLANLLGTGTTIATAKIADDAITDVKIGDALDDRLTLDGFSAATVTVNSAVSASATIVVDGVSGTIIVGMVVNVSDTTVRSITDAASQSAISVDDTLTITAVASQTSFTVSEAVSIADDVVLILRADENSKMVLDASAASTDVGDEILFEDATNDGSITTDNFSTNTGIDFTGFLANTMTTKSDGGAVTTNIAQGLVKSWTHADCTGTVGIEDSLNTSSLTEHANGVIQFTRANNMANVNYVAVMCTEIPSNAANNAHRLHDLNTTHYLQSYYQAGATADVDPFVTMMTGDLA